MIVKYNPFNDFGDFSRNLKLFQDAVTPWVSEGAAARPWTPPVDIVETENELIVQADVPEIKAEDIQVNFENGTLTLQGKREFHKTDDGPGYHRIERSYGTFTRAFTLPDTIDPDKLTADYKAGVLTVIIGKKEVAKPKSVKVNVHAAA